jgi:ComF family protein
MLSGLLQSLVDIIYPKKCLACKEELTTRTPDTFVCTQCWKKIKLNLPPFCSLCGRQLEAKNLLKNICPGCVRKELHFDRAFSPYRYDSTIKTLIHEFKYQGKDYLGKPLARLLIDFIREYTLPLDDLDLIIPVPLHKSRLREREFNQAQILSRYIAEGFSRNICDDNLVRNRQTKTQTELDEKLRLENIRGSFSLHKKEAIKNKNILLIDDVLTTGSTCSEAAFTLKQAGAKIVFVLTLAN